MDYKRYNRLYADGLCRVEKNGEDGYLILFKRFDNENGKELSPEFHHTTIQSLIQDRISLEAQLQAVKSILDDITKL